MPEQVDPVLRALGRPPNQMSMRMCSFFCSVLADAKQEDGCEEIPLQLEPGVRGHVEDLAHGGVDGADQNRRQNQPGNVSRRSNSLIRSIDRLSRSSNVMDILPNAAATAVRLPRMPCPREGPLPVPLVILQRDADGIPRCSPDCSARSAPGPAAKFCFAGRQQNLREISTRRGSAGPGVAFIRRRRRK